MRALVPGFEPAALESLEELEVGVAWLDERGPARPRARRGGGGALPAHAATLDFPLAADDNRLFMREVADVHRGLFPGERGRYGDNVRIKLERCLAVTDDEVDAARARTRRVPRALRGGARRRRPARDADGRLRRAARRRGRADDPRARDPVHVPVRRARAGRRSRCRAARRRTVSRPPSSSSGRRGDDSRVLAAGSAAGIPRSRDGWGVANAENEG